MKHALPLYLCLLFILSTTTAFAFFHPTHLATITDRGIQDHIKAEVEEIRGSKGNQPVVEKVTANDRGLRKASTPIRDKGVMIQGGDGILPGKQVGSTKPKAQDTASGNMPKEGSQEQPKGSLMDLDIKVYPNPGNGKFTVEIDNQKPLAFQLAVFDLTGKEILHKDEQPVIRCKTSINLTSHNDGIYLLKIQTGRHQKVIKLVKQ